MSITAGATTTLVPPGGDCVIRSHHGPEALRALDVPLREAGLLPAPLSEMEPSFLAAGLEGAGDVGAVVAYRDERPIAYLPRLVRRVRFRVGMGAFAPFRLPCRQLRLWDCAVSDGGPAPVDELFAAALATTAGWQLAQLFDLPEHSPLAPALLRLAGRPERRVTVDAFDTFQVALADDFDRYLRERFSHKTRYNLRREVRLLEAAAPGQVELRLCTAPDQVRDFLGDVARIGRRTYQWRLGFSGLPRTERLVERLATLAAHGRLRGYVLRIRGVPAAYCYATVRGTALSYDDVGYDPEFARLNPGKVLLYRIIEDLHASRVVERLDFGRGAAGYKLLFANASTRALSGTIYASGAYGRLLGGLAAAGERGYRRLRPLVAPWMPRIKRLVRGSQARSPEGSAAVLTLISCAS